MDIRYYETEVEKAYLYASGRLLHLMIQSEDLIAKLRTFKHFFLLDEDDFLPEFFLYAADDLRLPVSKIDKTKLFAVFEDALKASVLHIDAYKGIMRWKIKKTWEKNWKIQKEFFHKMSLGLWFEIFSS